MKTRTMIKITTIIGLAVIMLLIGTSSMLASEGANLDVTTAPDAEVNGPPNSKYQIFNLDLQLPQGARIDYLRIYYYDTSNTDSVAWVTTYDGGGSFSDLINVTSIGTSGYDYRVSGYVGHIVNNADNAYVLNWRPYNLGYDTQLCGLRVAYRLPTGGGGWSDFYYNFVAGSTLKPRSSELSWGRGFSGGCIFGTYSTYIPLSMRK